MRRSLQVLAIAAVALLSMSRVDAAVTMQCNFFTLEYFVTRGIYVEDYPGSTLGTVTLSHRAVTAGPRTIALSARLTTYDGTLIGVAQVSRDIGTEWSKSVFDFGGVAVPHGATITFTHTVLAGSAVNLYFDAGDDSCTGVTSTDDTAPPLSVLRRNSAGIIITGVPDSISSAWNLVCPHDNENPGDTYTRGFYVENYRGTTIDTVKLQHKSSVTGNRTINLVARLNTYDGPLVGVASVTRNVTSAWTESVFDFGNAKVPAGSTVTFQHILASGSIPLLYDYGYGPCDTVHQTQAFNAPLDTPLRDSVAVIIRGRIAANIGVLAIEYRHTVFDHYFLTADQAEIDGLDGGAYGGVFVRTGESFYVRDGPVVDTADVCRFFTVTFAPKSSHFYTADPVECAGVKLNPDWLYEKIAFFAILPQGGVCEFGRPPVYRMYNNGMTGAPNHRFVRNKAIYDDFTTNRGWAPEGIRFCSAEPLI